jgi:hypothetical protein
VYSRKKKVMAEMPTQKFEGYGWSSSSAPKRANVPMDGVLKPKRASDKSEKRVFLMAQSQAQVPG